MFNKIEMLKNANKYYLNMYGEIGEVADWCFDTGIINEMQPQGNVFNSEKEAVKEKARRFLKQEIKEFRNECNSYWRPCFGDGKANYCIVLKENELFTLKATVIDYFPEFGYFRNLKDCERAKEIFGVRILELYADYRCNMKFKINQKGNFVLLEVE